MALVGYTSDPTAEEHAVESDDEGSVVRGVVERDGMVLRMRRGLEGL